jgi:hypothetical protein
MNSGGQSGEAQRTDVRCPFYGFGWPAATRLLLQEPGNRCGLALDRVQRCTMEEAGRPADMKLCPLAEELAHFIRCASPVIAFATQEHPDGLRIPRGFGARWPIRDELRLPDNAVVSHVERQYRAPPETGPPKGAPW